MLDGCVIKHWTKTQSTVSLSSGEAELHGIAYGAARGLGLQPLLRDMGWEVSLRLHSDATAAIGICKRKGVGKVRHLATTDLWIQEQVRSGRIKLEKILGTENPADVFAKYVDRATMQKAMSKINIARKDGRPACAPATMGLQQVTCSTGECRKEGPRRSQ